MKQIKIFFFSSFILMILVIGFVYGVDPYDKFNFNLFHIATKSVAMSRENKFNMIEYGTKQYDAFLLGSSSAHRFNTQDIEDLTGMKTFNYAVQHTSPEDYLAITRHILEKQNPKMIFLQLDFDTLNKFVKTDVRLYSSPLKKYLLKTERKQRKAKSFIDPDYLTLGSVADSFKVLWVNYFGKVKHMYTEDGNYGEDKPLLKMHHLQLAEEKYLICMKRLSYLKEIKKLTDQRGIKLIVWTTPYSYRLVQQIFSLNGQKKAYEESLTALKDIFGEVHDFSRLATAANDNPIFYQGL